MAVFGNRLCNRLLFPGFAALCILGLAVSLRAQAPRLQFPPPQPSLPTATAAAPAFAPAPPAYPAPGFAPGYVAPMPGAPAAGGIFSVPPPGAAPYGAYPPVVVGPPGAYNYAPDPRFTQGASSIFPPNYSPPYPNGNQYFSSPDGGIWQCTKFIQGVMLEHTWLYGDSGRDLEQHDSDVAVTFALPIFPNPKNPLYISPGFGLHLWDGPEAPDAGTADLPGQAFDAYLDATWRPQFTEAFGAELAVRPGVYADFDAINTESFRVQGRGLAFIRLSPTFQVAAGAVYLDRLDIKLLPAGGVIWTPHERARYEILFPKPKLARYLRTSWTNTEWWVYLTGEYGGGSWTIQRAGNGVDPGPDDQIDINDIRVAIGMEFRPAAALDAGAAPTWRRNHIGYIEAGYVFEREILYRSGAPEDFELPDTFMLRAGVRF